jgi:hypothetical protein
MRRALAIALAGLLLLPACAVAEGEITARQATAVANRDPLVAAQRGSHPDLSSSANLVDGSWEVGYFSAGEEVALVLVDPHSGAIRESWTGYQVAWKMARGYSGSFGHKLNAPYVFLPLCAFFLLGLFDWRRPWRLANLDLLALLSFGLSNLFFNRAEIGVSVPLAYLPLLYLGGRALWAGVRGRGGGLRPVWPASWLLIAGLFLIGFRVGLNVADSGVIDVGYASVVGADRIAGGKAIYDNFPSDVSQGDTYGPLNYLAYVPFEAIWPWSGEWDDLPAAHAAAVFFDLATFALLLLLGWRIRPGPGGQKLAATLAFGWAAYPYTAYALESNSNDTLVALLLVATLLLISRPALRGVAAALATLAKFAPVLLAPMLATYKPPGPRVLSPGPPAPLALRAAPGAGTDRRQGRSLPLRSLRAERNRGIPTPPTAVAFLAAFAVAAGLVMAWPAIDPGLGTVWDRTIDYQAGRNSPFSIWGQAPSLEPLRIAILVAVVALAVALAFWPKRKNLAQLAALGAALLIGLQLTAEHWFYLYIVWFYPLLLIALVDEAPPRRADTQSGRSPRVRGGDASTAIPATNR